MRKKVILMLLSLFAAAGIAGCSKISSLQGASEDEIITTTAVNQDKMMITVRVEFGAGQQDNLEEILETHFPDVDIVLRHDGSTSSVYTMRANLENDVECDLILSRRLPTVENIADQYLLDLSSEDFVNNYYMNAVDSCTSADGKLYYLPGPSDVYGIVYDKTLFADNGWEVPGSYTEFMTLLKTIQNSGKVDTPIQVSLMYPDMFQILFNTYGFEDAYAGNDNFIWLTKYQQGQGSMAGHMEKAVSDFQALFDQGMITEESFDVTPSQRSQMLYTDHSTAMIIECQNALNYEKTINDNAEGVVVSHELGMMPFWTSDEEDSDFLYVIPSYYMAINKKSAEESDKKKEKLLEILSYLSSKEGQELLIGDNFQMSNINGIALRSNSFSENIINTIEKGNIINTFYLAEGETDKQVERQMLGTAKDMLTGEMSVEEWLLAADEARDQYVSGNMTTEEPLGQVDETMTRLETAYTVAQMYASKMGTEIGICRGGGWDKSTNGYLYQGDITVSSLACIEPDKEQVDTDDPDENKIVSAYLTGEQIVSILNDMAGPDDTKGFSNYFVAYGLQVEFNPWAQEGSRVISCKLADGTDIDQNESYEVAYFNGSLPDMDDIEKENVLDQSWQDAFISWVDEQGGVLEKPEMTLELEYE
jgi:ABC-type glycerol-3-phosphate transport system substrate-binding protein